MLPLTLSTQVTTVNIFIRAIIDQEMELVRFLLNIPGFIRHLAYLSVGDILPQLETPVRSLLATYLSRTPAPTHLPVSPIASPARHVSFQDIINMHTFTRARARE